MDAMKYFHFCDHKFPLTDNDAEIREILVENQGTLVDIISPRSRILELLEVKAKTYDAIFPPMAVTFDNPDRIQTFDDSDVQDAFFDVDDKFFVDFSQFKKEEDGVLKILPVPTDMYSLYLHNRIRWFVRPPLSYIVKVSVLFSEDREKQFETDLCPRCGGNGWFIDMFNKNSQFEVATGIDRVLQRVIKDLKTELAQNIFDVTDGTILNQILRDSGGTKTDDKLFTEIRSVVSEVEDKYLVRQATRLNELADSEILVRLECTRIMRSKFNRVRLFMELSITTRQETRRIRVPIS